MVTIPMKSKKKAVSFEQSVSALSLASEKLARECAGGYRKTRTVARKKFGVACTLFRGGRSVRQKCSLGIIRRLQCRREA